MRLRPYQIEGFERARYAFRAVEKDGLGAKSVLMIMPTGAGKTIVGAEVIRSGLKKGSRILFLAHRSELIEQAYRKITEFVPGCASIIMAGDKRVDHSRPVQVASVQTIVRRLDKMKSLRHHFDLIIKDEAHHATAKTYTDISEAWPNAKELGLTATGYRADGKGLGQIYQEMVTVTTIPKLTQEGFLVPTRTFEDRNVSLRGVHVRAGDYRPDELGSAVNTPKLVGNIIAEYVRHAAGRTAIAFAVNVEHSKEIQKKFLAEGVSCAHVDALTPKEEREQIFRAVGRGEILVLTNVGIATEGTDIPRVSCIINARPTKSRCLWRQMTGRGLRTVLDPKKLDLDLLNERDRWLIAADGLPFKEDCIILDHARSRKEHGDVWEADEVTLEDGIEKGKGKPREPVLITVTREQAELQVDESVTLEEATGLSHAAEHRAARVKKERKKYYKWLHGELVKMNYKPGWLGHRFVGRYGEEPTEEDMQWCSAKLRHKKGTDWQKGGFYFETDSDLLVEMKTT